MKRNVAFILTAIIFYGNVYLTDCIAQQTQNHNPINGNVLFGRHDPAKYMPPAKYGHGGAGSVEYMELTPREKFTSQFLFVHRGILNAKSGLGEHVHRWMEEMYFVMDDNTARFTVNGRTAELPGPCMVLCPMGSSHGIYNHNDNPIQFMNLAVTLKERKYDAKDFAKQNDLVDTEIESPPPFLWSVINKKLCQPVENFMGGKGTVYYRRIWGNDGFKTNWLFVNHYVVPPGSTIGYHRHDHIEEIYYILSGTGRMTIDGETLDVKEDDAGSCLLHGAHGFWNNSNGDVEMLSIAAAMEKGYINHVELDLEMKGR
ncbi:MAG: cupin domain-containing protein [Candidatus Latescibacteria bacterium]|jgi:mannose-6-phosphate isomerase-like protein (cupin superfamily)|nr:cupin domain-containing protein [Candidatus Latescibacterota bacterium]